MGEKINIKEASAVNLEKYKKDNFNYPDSSIAPFLKNEDYHMQWAEKLFSIFLTSQAWMPSKVYTKIDENRAYADGQHSMEQVKEWLLGKGKRPDDLSAFDAQGFDIRDDNPVESKRKAWVNIDFSPVSVAPKIFTKINEFIRSMYYEMNVSAVDSFSVRTEEHEKYRLWFLKEHQKWIESQIAAVGISPQQPEFVPESMEELELYAATGGFKVPYSLAMMDLLKHSFDISDWDKEVAERVRKDLFSNGYAIIKEEFDRELNRVVVKYCDIKYSGLQYSETNSFKNSEIAFELEFMEISKIRQRLNLDYQQAAMLAYSFSGLYGNPSTAEFENYGIIFGSDSGYYLGCDFYKVPVFNFQFLDIDNEQYLEFTTKHGERLTKSYKGEIQDNETLKQTEIRYPRVGKWIPGTQHIFDWGIMEYIPRDIYKKPRVSYRGVKLAIPPIIEQIKPFIKGFNLSWVKAQNAISMAVGNGLAVDIGALKNISIGKDASWDPMEVLSFYRQSQILLYKRQNSLSGFNKYTSPPVIPLNNSMWENIRTQFEAMNFYMQKIEETSGISMVSTGKAADPNVAKFNMQISIQGTNEIINNIARAQTDLQEDISTNICYRIRSFCRVNPSIRESYENVIGKYRMKSVIDAEQNHVAYGIKIEASNIDEQKRTIIGLLQASIDPNGGAETGKLSVSEAILIYDMIEQRQNLRRVALVLGYMLRRKDKEAREWKMKYIQEQGKQLQQVEAVKATQKQADQLFELRRMDKQFWADFTIKNGVPPNFAMGQPSQYMPSPEQQRVEQATQPMPMNPQEQNITQEQNI